MPKPVALSVVPAPPSDPPGPCNGSSRDPLVSEDAMRRFMSGDPVAVRCFVVTVGPIVRAVVRTVLTRRRASPDLEEDLLQIVLIEFWHNRDKVFGKWDPARGPVEPYLRTLAHNLTISELRRRGQLQHGGLEMLWAAEGTAMIDLLDVQAQAQGDMRDRYEWLDEAIDRYRRECSPEDWRLFLRFVEEADTDELMEEFGLGRDALYKRKQRMRERLLEIVRDVLSGK
jgi:RNA polymerase sigma factor (sigma-70 family)